MAPQEYTSFYGNKSSRRILSECLLAMMISRNPGSLIVQVEGENYSSLLVTSYLLHILRPCPFLANEPRWSLTPKLLVMLSTTAPLVESSCIAGASCSAQFVQNGTILHQMDEASSCTPLLVRLRRF